MKELFEDRWPRVRSLLSALQQYGIYYQDPKPGNIMFEDWSLEYWTAAAAGNLGAN